MNKKMFIEYDFWTTYSVSVVNAIEIGHLGGHLSTSNEVYIDFYLPKGVVPSFPAGNLTNV